MQSGPIFTTAIEIGAEISGCQPGSQDISVPARLAADKTIVSPPRAQFQPNLHDWAVLLLGRKASSDDTVLRGLPLMLAFDKLVEMTATANKVRLWLSYESLQTFDDFELFSQQQF